VGTEMRKQQFAFVFLALWLIIVSESMVLIGQIDIEIFLVLGLVCSLIIMQLMEHKFVQPNYNVYIKYNMVIWMVIFGIIVLHKIIGLV
jgi:hypothetical protein